MIGHFWSTGVTFREWARGEYSVWLEFRDNGFANKGSTSGTLEVHYNVSDLTAAIDMLIEDAENLGIEWGGIAGPTVYTYQDGEFTSDSDRPDLRRLANEQSKRLGWEQVYNRERIEDA